jgi:hypothetical protein
MALVGASAAFDATVQIDAKGAVLFQQIAQFFDSFLFPIFNQLAGETKGFLMLGRSDKGLGMGHRPFHYGGVFQVRPECRNFVYWFLRHLKGSSLA